MTRTLNLRFAFLFVFALSAALVATSFNHIASAQQGDLVMPIDNFQFSVPQPNIGDGELFFQQIGPEGCQAVLFDFQGNDQGQGCFFVPGFMGGGPILEPAQMDFEFPMQWSRLSNGQVMIQAENLLLDFEALNIFDFEFITHYDWHFWIIIDIDFDFLTFNGFYNSDDPLTDEVESLQLISPAGDVFYSGVASGKIVGRILAGKPLLGDVNGDGSVNLLDVQPFTQLLGTGGYSVNADINQDGVLNLLDVAGFVALLAG